MDKITENLAYLFKNWSGENITTISALPVSGSERQYFRMKSQHAGALGVYSPNRAETIAFIEFTKHFRRHGLPVPEIYATGDDPDYYLIQDLGDTSLFSLVEILEPGENLTPDILSYYKKALEELTRFQIIAGKNLDYDLCYPRKEFDRRSMLWDLNYFKYNYLKLAGIPFNEQELENDFDTLTGFLLQAGRDHFMYRDFQARNILIQDNKLYFIDYQGGRKGGLQYDIASLLFQVRAALPFSTRELLLDHYIDIVGKMISIGPGSFKEHYYGFVLIRLLQVLGAYGFRGLFEHKEHFLRSIPFAVENIKWFREHVKLPVRLPGIMHCIDRICEAAEDRKTTPVGKPSQLIITINSFSYKKGIPIDKTDNGGGFVFDCRALPNPGREEKYRAFTGKDDIIIDYLKDKPEVTGFLENVFELVDRSVGNYIFRDFSHLMISFGCTGGQHRSVYCAETLVKHLKSEYQVNVKLFHQEIGNHEKPVQP